MREESSIETNNKSAVTDTTVNEAEKIVKKVFNKIESYAKPDKTPIKKFTAVDTSTKKPSITSSSINAIENETNKKKKPLKKPIKGEEDDDDDILGDSLDDDDDDDDEDEEILNDDDDDNEKDSEAEEDEDEKVDGSEHENHEDEDEKGEIEDLDDDDDEEDAVISALVYDEKENGKKKGKVKKYNQFSEAYDDDSNYELGLPQLLAENRHSRSNRHIKETRFLGLIFMLVPFCIRIE
ncbi:nucleolar transcription factor 1-B-like [Bombus huntii]|uniref:nucleolar transcription factor 1-B-like n=1 Tax=Bombus huntii TaxID=85661 RepID=UPI0021A98637|nr:nucleolar transcription factor 1-B-like [Bombus huntii]